MDWKDVGGSPYLSPGEKPRVADPWVDPGSACPKCGHTDKISWVFNKATRCLVAECSYCGYFKEKYLGDVMPVTPGLFSLFSSKVTGKCAVCGRTYSHLSESTSPYKHLCRACGMNARRRDYKAKQKAIRASNASGDDAGASAKKMLRRHSTKGSDTSNDFLTPEGLALSVPGNAAPRTQKEICDFNIEIEEVKG